MIRVSHLVNAVTQAREGFHHGRRETTSAISDQDAWGTMLKLDVVQQEISDLRCGTGGKKLCFGEPSAIVYGNNNSFLPVSRFQKKAKDVHFTLIK